jgi:hypothetical protein
MQELLAVLESSLWIYHNTATAKFATTALIFHHTTMVTITIAAGDAADKS